MGFLNCAKRRVKSKARKETSAPVDQERKGGDDPAQPRGFLDVRRGDQFDRGRYTVKSLLGTGAYSTVWLANDVKLHKDVALKILSSEFYNGGIRLFELDVMRRINDVSATSKHPGRQNVMQFLDDFEHVGSSGRHVCLVLGVLGPTIDSEMEESKMSRLPYSTAKIVCRQMLQALDFLHSECGVLHTDIQTTNILLKPNGSTSKGCMNRDVQSLSSPTAQFCLGDFGLACWEDEHLTDRIQPPVLRAPEITLDAPWEASVDVFDLVCLIYYFVTGSLPFAGRPSSGGLWSAEDDRLRMLTEHFGSVPNVVLDNANRNDHFYDEKGHLRRTQKNKVVPLEGLVDECMRTSSLDGDMPEDDIPVFCDFLRDALATDPRKRKSAKDLLAHRWLMR